MTKTCIYPQVSHKKKFDHLLPFLNFFIQGCSNASMGVNLVSGTGSKILAIKSTANSGKFFKSPSGILLKPLSIWLINFSKLIIMKKMIKIQKKAKNILFCDYPWLFTRKAFVKNDSCRPHIHRLLIGPSLI